MSHSALRSPDCLPSSLLEASPKDLPAEPTYRVLPRLCDVRNVLRHTHLASPVCNHAMFSFGLKTMFPLKTQIPLEA